ncbi:MAG: KpsF/GutQ family sugar-phosphate isomerase [Opitutales bacterium]|nr:KpsF/GutQ family sugar-phosphate isomerase [Opitutales bacterium]MBR7106596.1 KpsF/GutQ family sugar-phosphate isomerase [Opitutales bacterium]
MDKSEILASGKAVLECEANSILGAVKRMDLNFVRAVETILSHKGKLLVCGVGKSGLVGQKITATLSSTGTPAVFLHACEAVHGDLGVYEPGDPTILISNSGSTVECVRLIPILKSFNSPIIALVGNIDSPMGRESDIVLDVSSQGEADPLGIVPTNSTTLALAMGDALACALMKARGFSKEDFARFHPAGQLGRNLLLKVGDVMHSAKDCAVATASTSVREVVIAMTQKPLGAACVLNSENKIDGFITDGDLRRMLQTVVDLDALKCSDIMTKSPICITPDASLGKAVEVMENRKSKISVLPVVDESGVFLGLLRLHDIYQPQ